MKKNAMVITEINENLSPYISKITNRKSEELVILSSYEGKISQPYGCLIRNIIKAVFFEQVNEIYIIVEGRKEEKIIQPEELYMKFSEMGIKKEVIHTIEYIDVVGHDVFDWLVGTQDPKLTIQRNIDLILEHPLIPKSVCVQGFIVDSETGSYEAVEQGIESR